MAQSTSEQRAAEFMTALRSRVAAQDLLQDAQVQEIMEGKAPPRRAPRTPRPAADGDASAKKAAVRAKASKTPRAPRKPKKVSGT